MERYLGGEEIDEKVLIDDLEKAVARGSFFPVIPVCSGTGVGTLELLEVATSGSRHRRNIRCPTCSLRRARHHAGLCLRPDGAAARRGGQDDVGPLRRQGQPGPGLLRHHQARRDGSRVGPFLVLLRSAGTNGSERIDRTPVGGRPRGPRRGRTDRHTVVPAGQAAAARGAPWWPATSARSAGCRGPKPETRCPTRRIRSCSSRGRCPSRCCRSRCSRAPRRRGQALGRLGAAGGRGPDAADRAEPGDPPDRAVVHGRGPPGVVLDALANRYGVSVDTVELRVPLRETFGGPAKGHGRHVKQSGGHGQFAVCDIEVEPLPEGAGFEFVDKVVGGAVPRQFIPSVEKGVRAQMEQGCRRRLSGRRHPGHAVRRQGTQRRLLGLRPSRWPVASRCGRPRGDAG